MTSPIEHFYLVKFSWIDGSSLSCFVPFDVLRVMITLVTILFPDVKSSRYYVFNSVISPYQTYFVYLIFKPIDLRKCYIRTSVFLTYDEKTYEATIGQNGTFGPSYWAMARAIAVLPVPGGPAKRRALPAIFFRLDEINCNTSGLSGEDLSDHTLGYFRCVTILLETESLDVGMGWYSLGFGGWSDFFDLVLRYALLWVEWPFCDEKWMYEKILNIFKNQNVSIILPLLYFSIF